MEAMMKRKKKTEKKDTVKKKTKKNKIEQVGRQKQKEVLILKQVER